MVLGNNVLWHFDIKGTGNNGSVVSIYRYQSMVKQPMMGFAESQAIPGVIDSELGERQNMSGIDRDNSPNSLFNLLQGLDMLFNIQSC